MTGGLDLSSHGLILGDVLGRGATGTVYQARQSGLDRAVAVKVFDPALFGAAESLGREIESTKLLRHPNLVAVYGGATEVDPRFLILELADPDPPTWPLPLREMVTVGIKLCSALALAHGAGIIHSDIKPANIMWHGGNPLLGDFGTARIEAITRYRSDLGFTPKWSPPWIPAASADRGSDVWSLAASLIWLHWGWDPPQIQWHEISPDLQEVFRLAMPPQAADLALGDEPALTLGHLLQQCQHGRQWPITSFPDSDQTNWSTAARHDPTVRSSGSPQAPDQATNEVSGAVQTRYAPGPPRSPLSYRVAPEEVADAVGGRALPGNQGHNVSAGVEKKRTRRGGRWWLIAVVGAAAIGAGASYGLLGTGGGLSMEADNPTTAAGDPPDQTSATTSESTAATSTAPSLSETTITSRADADGSGGDRAGGGATSVTLQSELVVASDQQGDLDIYRHRPDGTVEPIVDRDANDYAPALSPDGGQVVFESNEGGTRAIYIAPTDGSSAPRRVSPLDVEAADPAWSPDGRRLLWSTRAAGNWDIALHDLDTNSEIVVVTGVSDDRHASWSPDGQAIVFRSDRSGNGDIYRLRLDDQSLRQVTSSASEDDNPSINADGLVAFERWVGTDVEVFTVPVDSEQDVTRQTNHLGFDGSPTFDGDRLLYVRRDGRDSTIMLVTGGQAHELYTSSGLIQDIRIS